MVLKIALLDLDIIKLDNDNSIGLSIIKKLEEKYIIYSNGNKRNGLYFFIDFIDIF